MSTHHALTALVAILFVGGCAAAMPGYSPPTPKTEKMRANLPTGGGMAEDGHYVLNNQEEKLDCKKLNGAIQIAILQLRGSDQTPRPSQSAVAAGAVIAPVMGGARYGTDPDGGIARSRARVRALNARLAEKGCPTFDLDAELKPGNTGTPAPVRAAGKK
ncbi:MAG: hypothetical protein ACM31O_14950 [Bacteroidota bacterium]|jgi:hypothetical protein